MSRSTAKESMLPPRWLIFLSCVALFFWILAALKEIVVILVLGYCLAYVSDPILRYLERYKISRSFGFILLFGLFIVAVVLAIFTAVPTIVREYDKLAENFPQYVQLAKERGIPLLEKLKGIFPKSLGQGDLAVRAAEWLPSFDKDSLNRVLSALGSTLLRGYSLTLTLLNFLLLPFIAFYLAVDLHHFHQGVLTLFPSRHRKQVLLIAREIDGYVSAFVRGQLTVGCLLFLLYCLGLGVIGVELWFLLAAISGFGAIIPYFGFLCGIVLSSIMALATFGDFSHLAQVIGVYLLIQFIESWIITPKIIGDKVGLSPVVIILSIFAGGHLFGLLGVFLAVPGAAVVRVLMRHFHTWFVEAAA